MQLTAAWFTIHVWGVAACTIYVGIVSTARGVSDLRVLRATQAFHYAVLFVNRVATIILLDLTAYQLLCGILHSSPDYFL